MPNRKQKTALVTPRQQDILILCAAMPHRPNGMNNPWDVEPVTTRNFSCARGAAPKLAAGRQQFGARAGMDGAVHAAAAAERGIRRVYDRIHSLPGNITLYDRDTIKHAIFHLEPAGQPGLIGAAGRGVIKTTEDAFRPAHITDAGILFIKNIVHADKRF